MHRVFSVTLLALLTSVTLGQSKPDREAQRDACVRSLSSFAADPALIKPPEFLEDFKGVTIEYFESGCFGDCPSFTLHIEHNKAIWNGHAFVRKKGRAEKQLSSSEFTAIVNAWIGAKMYAMRDDYCQPTCPDGTRTMITDVQNTSITLITPAYSKQVSECFTTTDGKPDNPKPPQEYYQFAHRLVQFAKSNHWL